MNSKKIPVAFGLTALVVLFFQNCSKVDFETVPQASLGAKRTCHSITAPEVQPKLKWDWYAKLDKNNPANYPEFNQVMATPTVADLNKDGVPEVVFTSFTMNADSWFPDRTGNSYSANGVLRVVNGKTGANVFSIGAQELAPFASTSPLLVDLDGNGTIEIVYVHYARRSVIALNYDGSVRWIYVPPRSAGATYTGLAATDINNDGRADIILKDEVITEINNQPKSLVALEGSPTSLVQFGYPLEYGKSATPKIIGQNGVFDSNGKKLFDLNPNLLYAVADLYPETPGLEIVGTGSAMLQVYNGLTGELVTNLDLTPFNDLYCPSGSIGGGPPTIGDFDGNSETTEIAVATGRYLTIFTREGSILAKHETQDCSSRFTGISSFDFNGDGKPEILYADEEYLRIFEVHDGELRVVYKTVNPSGTLYEYPVVADIDGNGSSELVVSSNNYPVNSFYTGPDEVGDREIAANITGVRAFESTVANSWMPTRKIWNQFDFNPAMISEKGKVQSGFFEKVSHIAKAFRRNLQLGLHEERCE